MSTWRWGKCTTRKQWIATPEQLIRKAQILCTIQSAIPIGHMWNCFWEITDEPTVMPKKQSKQILPILRWVWSQDSWKSFSLFYFFCCLSNEIELDAFGIFPPSLTRDHLINSPHMHCDVAWLWVWWKNSIKQILALMGSRTGISLTSLVPNANFRLILEGQKLLWHLDCTQKHQTFVSRAWSLTQKMMSSKR